MSPIAGHHAEVAARAGTAEIDRNAAHGLVERLWVGLAHASLVAVWTGVSLAFVAAVLYLA